MNERNIMDEGSLVVFIYVNMRLIYVDVVVFLLALDSELTL